MQVNRLLTSAAPSHASVRSAAAPVQAQPALRPQVFALQLPKASSKWQLGSFTVAGVVAAAALRRLGGSKTARRAAALRRPTAPGMMMEWQMQDMMDVAYEFGGMRLFLDSADTSEWDRLLHLGFFSGVTTDPVSLQKAGVQCSVPSLKALLEKALGYPGIKEVMFQAWGEDHESLYKVACELHDLDPRAVVVKLPLTEAGMRVAAMLRDKNQAARICMTACCAAKQALVAGGLSVEYISADLDNMGNLDTGLQECARMQEAIGDKSALRVLITSAHTAEQVMSLASKGLGSFSLSPSLVDEMVHVPATMTAAQEFEQAARANNGDKKKKAKAGRRRKLAEAPPVEAMDTLSAGELAHEHV